MGYTISYVCVSHRGLCRQPHQDNFLCGGQILPPGTNGTPDALTGTLPSGPDAIFGVFDGMGGEEMGEMGAYLAAREALNTRLEGKPRGCFLDFCRRANESLTEYIRSYQLSAMGTTASVLSFTEQGIWLCHLGDSRIYRLREGKLTRLTADQVLPWFPGKKPPLAQYLGLPPEEGEPKPQITRTDFRHGDIYLICSDGLTDLVTEDEICKILRSTPYQTAASALLSMALSRGGWDNVTVLTCKTQPTARIPMFIKRLFNQPIV